MSASRWYRAGGGEMRCYPTPSGSELYVRFRLGTGEWEYGRRPFGVYVAGGTAPLQRTARRLAEELRR